MDLPMQEVLQCTFEGISNGGCGDCAYLAVAMAIADRNDIDLSSEQFIPGGTRQRSLRLLAAKEIVRNSACYPKAGNDPKGYALSMSSDAVPADGTIMQALAQVGNCELRIWKAVNDAPEGQPEDMQYCLFIIKPHVSVNGTASQKEETPLCGCC